MQQIFIKKSFITLKVILFCQVLYFLMMIFPSSPFAYAKDLKPYTEGGILLEIETLCWNRWCTDDLDLYFHTFNCSFDKRKCLFGFNYRWLRDTDVSEVKCKISVYSLVDIFKDSKTFNLSPKVYKQVDKCIKTHLNNTKK